MNKAPGIINEQKKPRKTMVKINRWDTGDVIYSGNFDSVKSCIEYGVSIGINFYRAELNHAELNGAELNGAKLPERSYSIPAGENYYLFISPSVVQAGCESHTPLQWRAMSESAIRSMDGDKSMDFYPRLLELMDFYLGKGDWPEWVK